MKRVVKSNVGLSSYPTCFAVKSSEEIQMRLPSLDKAINQIQQDEMFSKCDFKYRVEDDGVDGSVLIWLADYSENIGSSEFYEYSFIHRVFEQFEKAVRKDTGDIDFYFEPYDSVDFCGRAWFKLKNTTGKIFPNSIS